MVRKLLITILLCLFITSPAFGLQIIPGASGYGMDTEAGSGRSESPTNTNLRRVTNLNDSGLGSFRQQILDHNNSGLPSVIVFETSGTLNTLTRIIVTGDYLTIAFQTAPSPGFELKSNNNEVPVMIKASHALIQHGMFRPGDDGCPGPIDNLDAFTIDGSSGTVTHVIVDHNSFAWSIDETMSIWGHANGDIDTSTLRHNLFGPALDRSCHTNAGQHGFGPIVSQPPSLATGSNDILFDRNVWTSNSDRMPLLKSESALVTNNYFDCIDHRGTHLEATSGFSATPQLLSIVGNVYPKDPQCYGRGGTEKKPIWSYGIGGTDLQLFLGSEIYVDDNTCTGFDAPCYQYFGGTDPYDAGGTDPISWPTGLAAQLLPAANVFAAIIDNVGARPTDRDTVDTDIITNITNQTSTIINCVEKDAGNENCDEVGEYYIDGTRQDLAENYQAFVPVANFLEDCGSGWTCGEEQLQAMAAALEPRCTISGDTTFTESTLVASGVTLVATLVGDSFTTDVGTDHQDTEDFIDGWTSARSEAAGWNVKVRDVLADQADNGADEVAVTTVTSTRDTATFTVPATGDYAITVNETGGVTLAAGVLDNGEEMVCDLPSPNFLISNSTPPGPTGGRVGIADANGQIGVDDPDGHNKP